MIEKIWTIFATIITIVVFTLLVVGTFLEGTATGTLVAFMSTGMMGCFVLGSLITILAFTIADRITK